MESVSPQADIQSINDIFRILRRRKWSLILPALLILSTAAAVAYFLPPVYRSTATILIEEQEIPAEFVMATVTSYAEERIQIIKQRVLSFSRLNELITRFNLYPELRDSWTTERIVAEMRNNIRVESMSADVKDPRTGKATSATIAFSLSYEGNVPETVLQVTNTLTSLFLSENQQVRERQTMVTSQFLELEMNRVKAELSALDKKIAAFKETHMHQLPEFFKANLEGKERSERDIERLRDQIRTLKDRESFLQSQLSGLTVNFGNETKKRLEELKIQLAHLQTRLSDVHPDVLQIRREIADLEKQIQDDRSTEKAESKGYLTNVDSDNPAHATLTAQLVATGFEIDSLNRQIQDLHKSAEQYRSRIDSSPQVENAYNTLVNERSNTQVKYNDLMAKYMESQVAHGLEKERKGERFTILDPARLPGKPVKPNRMAIVLVGFVLAVGASVGFAAIREFSDNSIRDSRRLSRATPYPVLVSIPRIDIKGNAGKKEMKKTTIPLGLDPERLRKNCCACFFSDAPELGYYKVLRTKIMQICKTNNWNMIMITSAVPGEGKTVTAINLAAIFAKAQGQSALLVDCDLQRQSINRYLGVSSPMGLADFLQRRASLTDLIIVPGMDNLKVISGKNSVRDSSELISSPKMARLTRELKIRYPERYFFFDLPPLLVEADALAFSALADCILMVVHPKTSFEELQSAIDMLPKEKLLGFVLNQVDTSSDDYYRYNYGYRYGEKK